eukprot:Opistho-2@2687
MVAVSTYCTSPLTRTVTLFIYFSWRLDPTIYCDKIVYLHTLCAALLVMERLRKSTASLFGGGARDTDQDVLRDTAATGRSVNANEPEANTTQAVMPQTAALPLVVVLTATAVKDAWEDYKRGKNDTMENARKCFVVTVTSEVAERTWADVAVGDIVRLVADDPVPADMLILATSDEDGECYIDTASLDGQTNLKVREAHPLTADSGCDTAAGASRLRAAVEAEEPNNNLFRFQGTLNIGAGCEGDDGGFRGPIAMRHMLLRGCTLRNTEWVHGLVLYAGHDTKILRNDMRTRLKRSKVDSMVQNETLVVFIVLIGCCVFASVMSFVWENQHGQRQWPLANTDSPSLLGFINFWTFAIILQSMVPISLYVTVEMVKVFQAYFIGQDLEMYHAETDTPAVARTSSLSEELGQIEYIFSDKTGTLTMNSMVFAGCSIAGRPYALDEVPVGDEARAASACTAAMGDLTGSRRPLCTATRTGSDCSAAARARSLRAPFADRHFSFSDPNLMRDMLDNGMDDCVAFFTAIALCHTALPEKTATSRPGSGRSRGAGGRVAAKGNAAAIASIVAEGTITVDISDGSRVSLPQCDAESKLHISAPRSGLVGVIRDASCEAGSGIADDLPGYCQSLEGLRQEDSGLGLPDMVTLAHPYVHALTYQAQSPDEAALVSAARDFGVAFLGRTQSSATVNIRGRDVVYTLLNVLEFNSDRKRMSVIVRDPDSKRIVLVCKGADDVMVPLLRGGETDNKAVKDTVDITEEHLKAFARRGLRTLVIARREITDEAYALWSDKYMAATMAVDDREARVDEMAAEIEQKMELLGVTAVDDKLQEGVPDTIAALAMAGIRLWVLTGDKQETAVNVGHACRLLTDDMHVTFINAETSGDCARQLDAALARLDAARTSVELIRGCGAVDCGTPGLAKCGCTSRSLPDTDPSPGVSSPVDADCFKGVCDPARNALVIDGVSLQFALADDLQPVLMRLSDACASVVCCRCTPVQKAAVVQMVRHAKKAITLAIGDGGNDVGMLKAAEIGVGISGKEGMQAVMASDYAIAQFRFLKRLLLVHGRWSYKRISSMVLYFFYKNFVFISVNLWYGFFSGFSGQTVFQFSLLMFYNLAFTSLPPIAFAVLDKDVPATAALAMPQLYAEGLNNLCFNRRAFWIAIADGVYQSLIAFFIPYWAHSAAPDGKTDDIWCLGVTIYSALIVMANARLALEVHNWNSIITGLMLGSVSLWWFYMLAYMNIMPGSNSTFGVVWQLFANPSYWLTVLLVIVLALLPAWVQKHVARDSYPLPSQLVREQIAFGIPPFGSHTTATYDASLKRSCPRNRTSSQGRWGICVGRTRAHESPVPVRAARSDAAAAKLGGDAEASLRRRASVVQAVELVPIHHHHQHDQGIHSATAVTVVSPGFPSDAAERRTP